MLRDHLSISEKDIDDPDHKPDQSPQIDDGIQFFFHHRQDQLLDLQNVHLQYFLLHHLLDMECACKVRHPLPHNIHVDLLDQLLEFLRRNACHVHQFPELFLF